MKLNSDGLWTHDSTQNMNRGWKRRQRLLLNLKLQPEDTQLSSRRVNYSKGWAVSPSRCQQVLNCAKRLIACPLPEGTAFAAETQALWVTAVERSTAHAGMEAPQALPRLLLSAPHTTPSGLFGKTTASLRNSVLHGMLTRGLLCSTSSVTMGMRMTEEWISNWP